MNWRAPCCFSPRTPPPSSPGMPWPSMADGRHCEGQPNPRRRIEPDPIGYGRREEGSR